MKTKMEITRINDTVELAIGEGVFGEVTAKAKKALINIKEASGIAINASE